MRCEFCNERLLDERVYADPETIDAGVGVTLCTRQRCIEEREAMSLRQRLSVYLGRSTVGGLRESQRWVRIERQATG
jgi:hypothetical protein